jgi:hypothetical protein
MRLGGHSAIQPEEARLIEAALEYHTEAVVGRGLVRAQLLDERVAPGGGVGVEVLIGQRVGPKARADAQVDARDLAVGRAVLVRDVLDQARAPAHGVRAPRVHGAAKIVDARVLGPDHRVRIGGSSRGSSCGHSGNLVGVNPRGGYL